MTAPLQSPGRWIPDERGQGRGVRVSAHAEAGFLVLSTWKSGTCVGTVRLLPDEAAALVAGIAEGLAQLTQTVQPDTDIRVWSTPRPGLPPWSGWSAGG